MSQYEKMVIMTYVNNERPDQPTFGSSLITVLALHHWIPQFPWKMILLADKEFTDHIA